MPDAGSIRAGRAYVQLSADDTELSRGLKVAEAKLKAWGEGITSIGTRLTLLGGIITAPILGATYAFVSSAVELSHMSERTGIAVEALSALVYAAQRSGVSMEVLEHGIRRMQRAIYEAGGSFGGILAGQASIEGLGPAIGAAVHGSGLAKKAFETLGVSAKELGALGTEEALNRLADALAKVPDPLKRAALTMQIFGKQGTELLPFLLKGAEKINEFKRQAAEWGAVITEQDVVAAKQFKAALAEFTGAMTGLGYVVARAVLPVLIDFRGQIAPAVTAVVGWLRQNASLAVTLLKVGSAITATGLALAVLGKVVSVVAGGFGYLAAAFRLTGVAVAFLFTPLGLVVSALTAAAASYLFFSEQGRAALDRLTPAWKAVVKAVASGDLKAALRSVLDGVKSVWAEAVRFFTNESGNWLLTTAKVAGGIFLALKGVQVAMALTGAAAFLLSTAFTALATTARLLYAAVLLPGMALSLLSTALGAVMAVIPALGAAFAFLISPAGLLIVAIGALTAALLYFTVDLQKMASDWSGVWGGLKDTALTAWGGIADALQAGNLSLALEVAGAALKLVWLETIGALKLTWLDFVGWYWTAVISVARGFATVFNATISALEASLNAVMGKLGQSVRIPRIEINEKVVRQLEDQGGARSQIMGEIDHARGELDVVTARAHEGAVEAGQKAAEATEKKAPGPGAETFGQAVGIFSSAGALRLAGGTKDVLPEKVDKVADWLEVILGVLQDIQQNGGVFA